MFVIMAVFLIIELKRTGRTYGWAVLQEEKPKNISWYALLTPIIPLILVLGFAIYNLIAKPAVPFEFPIITALIIGLLYGFISTYKKEESLNLLTRSIIEGIGSVAPAVALVMGIGMVLEAVMHPQVAKVIGPILAGIMPTSPIHYVIFFVILAPLALYRGPLNIWGMGSGLIGLMLATRALPPAAIMAALMSVGQIQGVCDPTNTHNVWIANYLNINVQDILKRTILYVWILAVIGLIIAGIKYF
jgi:hypothetical protein